MCPCTKLTRGPFYCESLNSNETHKQTGEQTRKHKTFDLMNRHRKLVSCIWFVIDYSNRCDGFTNQIGNVPELAASLIVTIGRLMCSTCTNSAGSIGAKFFSNLIYAFCVPTSQLRLVFGYMMWVVTKYNVYIFA